MQPREGRGTVDLVIRSPIGPADVPSLCARARAAAAATGDPNVVCDVAGLVEPDLATIEALARLQVVVRRRGGRVLLRDAADELTDLLELTGLLGTLCVEARGEPEEREEVRGVEEEDDPADRPAGDL